MNKYEIDLPIKYEEATPTQRKKAREEYVKQQENCCYYCGEPLDEEPHIDIVDANIDWSRFPNGFQKYPVHLHHSHRSGLTLGAVHMRCNAYLWQYKGE